MSDELGTQSLRRWRVSAAVGVPMKFMGRPLDGGLPERLEPAPAITGCQRTLVDGVEVCARPWPNPEFGHYPMGPVQWVEFFVDLQAADHMDAAERGGALIQVVLDSLSLRMGASLVIAQLEAIDVTPDVAEGDERAYGVWPFPNGYPTFRFAISQALGHLAVEQTIALRRTYERAGGRESRALDWYLKAANSPYDVDQFIFLWIALEVLLDGDADVMVEAPYQSRCGHTISNCPECGVDTRVQVRGKSLRAYLKRYGASEEDARDLWRTRQMMHGKNDLSRDAQSEVPRHVQVLRRALVQALKERLHMPSTDAPIAAPEDVATIDPHFALSGTSHVTSRHLSKC